MIFGKKKVLTAVIGAVAYEGIRAIVKSKSFRTATVQTLAKGMEVSDKLKANIEDVKEDAQDLYEEAKEEARNKKVQEAIVITAEAQEVSEE